MSFRGETMVAYRLYCMDGLGKIGHVECLEADDDDQAIHLAFEKKLAVVCEVWDRARLVATIPPCPENSD